MLFALFKAGLQKKQRPCVHAVKPVLVCLSLRAKYFMTVSATYFLSIASELEAIFVGTAFDS